MLQHPPVSQTTGHASEAERSGCVSPRLLCVASREPSWVGLTLQLDHHGCREPQLVWVSSAAEAAVLLRRQPFDCVLIEDETLTLDSPPPFPGVNARGAGLPDASAAGLPTIDAVALAEALASAGCETPLLVLAASLPDGRWCRLLACGCQVLVSRSRWDSPAIAPAMFRAVRHAAQGLENLELRRMQQQRLQRERDEADELLQQQQQIVGQLQQLLYSVDSPVASSGDSRTDSGEAVSVEQSPALPPTAGEAVPAGMIRYYHELLRTSVMMGSGCLSGEIRRLAEMMVAADLGPREAMQLHLAGVESLVGGLGRRSTRHVLSRASLAGMELVMLVGECWKQRTAAPQDSSAADDRSSVVHTAEV